MELEGIWHFMCWRLLPSLPVELQVNLWEHLGDYTYRHYSTPRRIKVIYSTTRFRSRPSEHWKSALGADILHTFVPEPKDTLNHHTNLKSQHMGGCQNYGPFLGPYYNTAPII